MQNSAKVILGIDPGLVNTGWGLIESHQNSIVFIASGVIVTNNKDNIQDRLCFIHKNLSNVLIEYNPDECSIEDIFVNINNLTSLKLGYARGAAILTIGLAQKKIFEYSPNFVKKAIVGKGKADKMQMKYMVNQLLPKSQVENEHQIDALALAICHTNHQIFANKLSIK